MRLVKPANTLPGPHSALLFTPCVYIACTVSTQRTGEYNWRTKASLICAAIAQELGKQGALVIGTATTAGGADNINSSLKEIGRAHV